MRINHERILGIMGVSPKPMRVWQQQFDGFGVELDEMARLDWDKIPDQYLWNYFHDLAYVELQHDLIRHLFPTCIKFWYETLMRDQSAEIGDSDFHYAIMRGNFLKKFLTSTEMTMLNEFFHDGFIDRIEAQNSFKEGPRGSQERWCWQNSWIFV